jgi:predicted ATPase
MAELLDKGYVPEYMRDFIMKVTDRLPIQENTAANSDIVKMMKGKFYFDPQEREFVFEKEAQTFKGSAIASGIKYLGIISILLQGGFLNKKTLLIFDELENHLHPDWQVKAARVVVDAVKEGGNILLTSHSPYLIEALKIFSDKHLEKGRAAFYLSRSDELGHISSIDNVTHDVSPIFNLLAGPFRELEKIDTADM